MLTIFSCPKAFTDSHIATIQHNAIASWLNFLPPSRVLILGSDDGVASAAKEYGVRHESAIECNEFGTPLLSNVFSIAKSLFPKDILAYVNSDMILFPDIVQAVSVAQQSFPEFLLTGSRWNLDVRKRLSFSDVSQRNTLWSLTRTADSFQFWGLDYFAFSPDAYGTIPPFAIGRGSFDGWLLREPRIRKIPVIDATADVFAVHQNHDYGHLVDGTELWHGPEFKVNQLLRHDHGGSLILEATHRLSGHRLHRYFFRKERFKALRFTKTMLLKETATWRHRLGIRRSLFSAMANGIRLLRKTIFGQN